jgi:hypothetical protein
MVSGRRASGMKNSSEMYSKLSSLLVTCYCADAETPANWKVCCTSRTAIFIVSGRHHRRPERLLAV